MKAIFLTVILCILSIHISNAQWVEISNGIGSIPINSLVASGNNLFAGASGNSGVFLSTDNGLSWTQTSLNNRNVKILLIYGNSIFAGTDSNGIYMSSNNGSSWIQTSLNNQYIRQLAVSGNNLYAGSYSGNGVYKSTDNGTTWTQTSLNNENVRSMAVNGDNIYVGSGNIPVTTGFFVSTNNGTNWSLTSLHEFIASIAVNGNDIFAGSSSSGIHLSTDNGTTWTQTSLNTQSVHSIKINGINIYAGTYNAGVYVSNDYGATWMQRNEGLLFTGSNVFGLCVLNNYLLAGLANGSNPGVYRRPIGELIGIRPISNEVPDKFSLSQNYPNPFNPSTKIKFALPKSSFAKLVVYDALGRELVALVNEQLNAGTYEAVWSADRFSSGVYYYKITAGDYSQINKMILLK